MSHKPSEARQDASNEVRNLDTPPAQPLRSAGATPAQPGVDKPCDNGDCGFEGPWHCGCLCVRKMGNAGAASEEFAPDRPTEQDTDADRSSNAA